MTDIRGDNARFTATMREAIEGTWISMAPIRVGPVPTEVGTPQAYVTIERDGQPYARVDAYSPYRDIFATELIFWQRFLILGWRDMVHLIDPAMGTARDIACSGYFAYLHPLHDRLLIATASELICCDADGNELWRQDVAVDGVLVDEVRDGIIFGRGDDDPPDGWQSFCIRLADGSYASTR